MCYILILDIVVMCLDWVGIFYYVDVVRLVGHSYDCIFL